MYQRTFRASASTRYSMVGLVKVKSFFTYKLREAAYKLHLIFRLLYTSGVTSPDFFSR